jgi:hypothetical protein
MGKTTWKILAGLAVILLFAAGVILALRDKGAAPATDGNSRLPANSNPLVFDTPKGQVKTKDFTQNPAEKTSGALAIKETSDYSIVYYEKDRSFVITLLSAPAAKARDAAEDDFLAALNINPAEACRLKVSLTVPLSVDESLSGKDYGLSFCPNGTQF